MAFEATFAHTVPQGQEIAIQHKEISAQENMSLLLFPVILEVE